jgi:hypothetical protein
MEKKVVQQAVYEYKKVQVGIEDKEVWIANDGTEFHHKQHAEDHEFHLSIKSKVVNLPYYASICYFENQEQVKTYMEKQGSYSVAVFEPAEHSYPNWFAIFETEWDDDGDGYYTYFDMKHFDDFTGDLIQKLEEAKGEI